MPLRKKSQSLEKESFKLDKKINSKDMLESSTISKKFSAMI
jgi:hypothetical protein